MKYRQWVYKKIYQVAFFLLVRTLRRNSSSWLLDSRRISWKVCQLKIIKITKLSHGHKKIQQLLLFLEYYCVVGEKQVQGDAQSTCIAWQTGRHCPPAIDFFIKLRTFCIFKFSQVWSRSLQNFSLLLHVCTISIANLFMDPFFVSLYIFQYFNTWQCFEKRAINNTNCTKKY